MTQEVRITLTLEVDVTQTKEDIIDFAQEMIENYTAKVGYAFMPPIKVVEESEIYNND